MSSHRSIICSIQKNVSSTRNMVAELHCKHCCQTRLPAWTLARIAGKTTLCVLGLHDLVWIPVCCDLSSNVSHGRNDNKDGGDRVRHRPAGNEHRHRAHCKEGCRPDNPGSSSVDRADRMVVWGKLGKLDASAKGGWNGWELDMLSYVGQLP